MDLQRETRLSNENNPTCVWQRIGVIRSDQWQEDDSYQLEFLRGLFWGLRSPYYRLVIASEGSPR